MTAPACACGRPSPDAVLCTDCTRDLAMALITAARIAEDLDDAIARLLKRGTGGKTGATEAPLPIDLAASEVSDRLLRALAFWAHAFRAAGWETGHSPVSYAAMFLLRHLGDVRRHQHAARMLAEIRRAVRDALAVVDRLPERVPAGQCEACGAPLLAELGADEVTCRCGTTAIALLARRRERAAAADVLGTATEIAGALDHIGIRITASAIRTWASRGRLAQRPGAVYAMSDVLALSAQRDSRT